MSINLPANEGFLYVTFTRIDVFERKVICSLYGNVAQEPAIAMMTNVEHVLEKIHGPAPDLLKLNQLRNAEPEDTPTSSKEAEVKPVDSTPASNTVLELKTLAASAGSAASPEAINVRRTAWAVNQVSLMLNSFFQTKFLDDIVNELQEIASAEPFQLNSSSVPDADNSKEIHAVHRLYGEVFVRHLRDQTHAINTQGKEYQETGK